MKCLLNVWFGLVFFVLATYSNAFSMERYIEGVHYRTVEGAQYQANSVVEFFSYGCPHCYRLEPNVEAWLKTKPEAVDFIRVPVAWSKKFVELARFYYTLKTLGIVEQFDQKVFHYIHEQDKDITSEQDAVDFMAAHGGVPDKFSETWNSDKTKKEVLISNMLPQQYKVKGVPAMVINGKYMTTVAMAGSVEDLFTIVDYLLRTKKD